jgi:hypothetical protein
VNGDDTIAVVHQEGERHGVQMKSQDACGMYGIEYLVFIHLPQKFLQEEWSVW